MSGPGRSEYNCSYCFSLPSLFRLFIIPFALFLKRLFERATKRRGNFVDIELWSDKLRNVWCRENKCWHRRCQRNVCPQLKRFSDWIRSNDLYDWAWEWSSRQEQKGKENPTIMLCHYSVFYIMGKTSMFSVIDMHSCRHSTCDIFTVDTLIAYI